MRGAISPFDPADDDACPVIAVCGLAFEAAIAAGPGVVTLCGPGSDRLAARLQEQVARRAGRCRGIISFGVAGGLDPALAPGACVIAEEIAGPAGRLPVDAGWLRALRACLPQAIPGVLAGVDQPLRDAAAKARLWQSSGACAVDMESHRAALVAQAHGLPFAACRIVADPAGRSLPSAAMAGLRGDGSLAPMRVFLDLAAHPWHLPALLRLARDAGAARRTLRAVRAQAGAAFALPARVGRLAVGPAS